MAQPTSKQIAETGTHIFVYNNFRTNQVIYSLRRTLYVRCISQNESHYLRSWYECESNDLQNHDALKQIPFLGKKTVPASLRKDLWRPLCHIEFPRPSDGVVAYRRLRELRHLHETRYPIETIRRIPEMGRGSPLHSTKVRGKILMDQKANSIADMAAVLKLQKQGRSSEHNDRVEHRIRRVNLLKSRGKKKYLRKDPQPPPEASVDGVKIRWTNLLDAEYAQSWPKEVVHDSLATHRYTAAFPEAMVEESTQQQETQAAEEKVRRDEAKKTKEAPKIEVPRALPIGKPMPWYSRFAKEKTEGGDGKTSIPAALLERPKSWLSKLRGQ
ncbi:MAG: hypothetical protein Q9174_002836 [Haloplaca sp. 1 TL-2023]